MLCLPLWNSSEVMVRPHSENYLIP